MIITRTAAIDTARTAGALGGWPALLNKYADPIEGARYGLTVAEAEAVAAEDPSLIWLNAASNEEVPPMR